MARIHLSFFAYTDREDAIAPGAGSMEIELRPLNLGEILDRTFQLYRARFLTFIGIAAFGAGILLLWELAQVLGLRLLFGRQWPPAAAAALNGIGAIVSWGVFVIALAVVLAAMNRAVTALYLGDSVSIARSYAATRGRWFRYILLSTLALLVSGAPIVLASLSIFLPVALAPRIRSLWGANVLTLTYASAGMMLLCAFPLSVWLMLRYSLSNAASAFEDIGIRKALRRSVQLSKGLRAKILVLLLLATAAQSLVAGVFILPVLPFALRTANSLSFGMNIYTFVMGFISHVLTVPIYGIGLTLFYFDARIRKEGFDVEWLLDRSIEAARGAEEISQGAGLDLV
jgi:hypothetical protein